MTFSHILFAAAAVFSSSTNPITDEVSHSVTYGDRSANMVVTCWPTRRKLQITFDPGELMWEGRRRASGYYEPLIPVRIGNSQPVQMRFLIDGKRAHLIDREYTDSVVSALAGGAKIVVQFTSYEKAPVYFMLDSPSMSAPMQKLRKECPALIK